MNAQDFKRKLTAVFSADVKGYSRLMEDDEEATVRTINARREVITDLTKEYRGRVVDAKGDNVLAEFSSVVEAVKCAVEIQRKLREQNTQLPEHRKMKFRIGINLGDVIDEGDTIYGDGVNIAARLESMAEVGGICISGTAYDQVENKLGLEFDYLGEQAVKNINKPIRVYRIKMGSIFTTSKMEEGLPLPDKPSIAVLPFVNMSGDTEQEYFSDGMSEDIITALSRLPDLFVIARNSTFQYKNKQVNVLQVGQELGVRYVLEGSVRKVGNRVRITAQLIDASAGHHLWAERYDRDLEDIFALEDEITMKILIGLQVKLTEGEEARVYGKGTQNLETYLSFLQAREEILRCSPDALFRGRQMVQKAITLDSGFAPTYHLLACTYMQEVVLVLTTEPKQAIAKAVELEENSLALDDSLSPAHALLGWLYTLQGQHDKSITECEQAVRLEPNSAEARYWLAVVLKFSGRGEESIAMCKEAMRLDPIPASYYYQNLTSAHCLTGQYEQAIKAGQKAVDLEPNNMVARAFLAVAYSLIGKEQEARTEAREVMRINPKFSVDEWERTMPFKNRADKDLFIAALRKAALK
jgi:adenylate cyclase